MFLAVCRRCTSRKTRVVAPEMFRLTCRVGAHISCYAHDTRLTLMCMSTSVYCNWMLYLNVVLGLQYTCMCSMYVCMYVCVWLDVMNFRSLSRGATCHEGPLLLRTGGGRSWQVLLYSALRLFNSNPVLLPLHCRLLWVGILPQCEWNRIVLLLEPQRQNVFAKTLAMTRGSDSVHFVTSCNTMHCRKCLISQHLGSIKLWAISNKKMTHIRFS